jgi:ABC-type antimicrobial peptide transport system permease subunit
MNENSRWFSDQSYIGDMLVNLDDKFICPFPKVDKTNINAIRAKAGVLFYEIDDINNLNETSALITNKASMLNLKITNNSIRNDIKEYNSNFKNIFYLNLILGLFIGIVSILGIAIITLSSIIVKKREIGIRMMTGSSIFNITILVIGEIFTLIFISTIISISFIIYNKAKLIKTSKFNDVLLNPMNNITPKIIVFSVLIIIILTGVISIIPILQIKRLQPRDLIGGKD